MSVQQVWSLGAAAVVGVVLGTAVGWLVGHARGRVVGHDLAVGRSRGRADVEAASRAHGDAVLRGLAEHAEHLSRLEVQRARESAVLGAAVEQLRRANDEAREETRRLASAMSDGRVRGSWGEMQLRRVLELAGMMAHADFVEQPTLVDAGRRRRPDVVVQLPNGRCVVIDAKAPLSDYLRAMDSDDRDTRASLLERHGESVAAHVRALSAREYDRIAPGSVDFVVMFVPGDAFLAAAFDARPELLEHAASHDVILASPSTLLAFLRGVACGWSERDVAEHADAVAALGRQLHERIAVFAEHLSSVGTSLERSVASYNSAVGSFERRLAVAARRLGEQGASSGRELVEPHRVDPPSLHHGEPTRSTAEPGHGLATGSPTGQSDGSAPADPSDPPVASVTRSRTKPPRSR